MSRLAGDLITVGIGKEATRGTTVAPTFWLPWTDLNFDDHVQKVADVSSVGVIDKNNAEHVVKQWADGTIKGLVLRNSFGLILASLAGQTPTTTTVETTAKKHVFTMLQNSNSHLSLTLAKKDPNLDLRFGLGMIDTLKITYVADQYINYEATYVSKKSASASNTPSFVTETRFLPKHVVFKTSAIGIANLGAASALTDIKSMTLELKKNVSQLPALGTVDLFDNMNTDFEVTGTIEKYYTDSTFKDYVFNNTGRALRFDLIDTDDIVGAVTNPSLRFDFDEVNFDDWSESMSGGNIVTETIKFTAVRNAGSGKTVSTIEIVNDNASY